ncbi:Nnf1-domain-containing protein [Gamsiella multidivaricata]|uniref:Nnf1-domain-containing protein n=1 Tax=Gamsiella multidivaricata TaxID=101098 RepID=UPI00221E6CD0|nr:Nnf1-domain-containing protein [Gamsiella multidivaricata]KAI7817156.1 Nnf1-domain-containing protein [Gamsiella multidivaricata]
MDDVWSPLSCEHNRKDVFTKDLHSYRSPTQKRSMILAAGAPPSSTFTSHSGEEESLDTRQDGHDIDIREEELEPEGQRMTRLRELLSKSLQETLKACNYRAICQCFPTLAAANPEELRNAHEKVFQFLNVEVENEFEQIIEERNVVFKLNGLDRLIADAKSKGRTAGSRTILELPPEIAVRARTVPTKEAEIERLKAELERVAIRKHKMSL